MAKRMEARKHHGIQEIGLVSDCKRRPFNKEAEMTLTLTIER